MMLRILLEAARRMEERAKVEEEKEMMVWVSLLMMEVHVFYN